MGDSLMYSILPLQANSLGFALPLVGVLLSANRFVRLLSNRWAGTAFERLGSQFPFLASVVLGLLSTFVYGLQAGFIVFLLARMAWGVAWSGLRQGGYVATWSGEPGIRGRLTGLLLGLVRLGSAVGVVLGGILFDRYGFTPAVVVVGAIGVLAVPVALAIPWRPVKLREASPPTNDNNARAETSADGWQLLAKIALEHPVYRWLTISSFFIYLLGGIIISTTSIFIAGRFPNNADMLFLGLGIATLTGLLHGTRWVTNLLVGPIVGALSDSFGKANTLFALGVTMLFALGAVSVSPAGIAVLSLLIVLLLDGSLHVVVNATASTEATDTDRPHTFVAAFATMTDAGSAFGPIIAFSALANTQLPTVYLVGATILLACLLKYWLADRKRYTVSQEQQHVP